MCGRLHHLALRGYFKSNLWTTGRDQLQVGPQPYSVGYLTLV